MSSAASCMVTTDNSSIEIPSEFQSDFPSTNYRDVSSTILEQDGKDNSLKTDKDKKHEENIDEDSLSDASSMILNRVLQRDSSTREADPSGRIFR